MQRTIAAIVLLGLVLASLLAVGATSSLSAQQAEPDAANDTATVTVDGSGEVTTEPDLATVHLVASASGSNASEATTALAENASTLRSALNSSAQVETVRSTSYDVSERRDAPGSQDPVAPGQQFVAEQTFETELADTDVAGDVIDLAVGNGASEVRGAEFTLSDDRHEELRHTAIDRAVNDSDDQAAAIANSTGLDLGAVQSVSSTDRDVQPVAQAEADAGSTQIDVTDVTVRASVQVRYEASGEGDDG